MIVQSPFALEFGWVWSSLVIIRSELVHFVSNLFDCFMPVWYSDWQRVFERPLLSWGGLYYRFCNRVYLGTFKIQSFLCFLPFLMCPFISLMSRMQLSDGWLNCPLRLLLMDKQPDRQTQGEVFFYFASPKLRKSYIVHNSQIFFLCFIETFFLPPKQQIQIVFVRRF